MLTILLFLIGVFYLYNRSYANLITIIIVLATTFLQLQVSQSNTLIAIPGTNVSDFGILLYLLFFVHIRLTYGIETGSTVQKFVTIFYIFLILNGVYDYINGTLLFDIIRYLKGWILLSIVYIAPYISTADSLRSFKQLYYITLISCVLVLVISLTGRTFDIIRLDETRGVKPPPYCMIFAPLVLLVLKEMPFHKRIIHFLIFITPIITCMKMTYAITVVLIIGLYIFLQDSTSALKKFLLLGAMFVSVTGFLYVDDAFYDRFTDMAAQQDDIAAGESSGNFSYRILHAQERFNYIAQDPVMLFRGFGYLQEEHLEKPLFIFGTGGGKGQLDTGDIAWSLFFIRLGLFGIFLWLLVFYAVVKDFWQIHYNPLGLFMFVMMIVYLGFTSLGNCLIYYSDFFIYPCILGMLKYDDSITYLEETI